MNLLGRLFTEWLKQFDTVNIKAHMATPISTVKDILISLNGKETNGNPKNEPWGEVPDPYLMTEVSVTSASVNPKPTGLVLKAFINKKTAEVKVYLTKWLDTPEGKILP